MSTSSKQNVKTKKNWMENDSLIAEGILSLLRKGRGVEQIRNTEIMSETGIDRDVVHHHLKDHDFFDRNYRRISEDFLRRVGRTANTGFAPVFLSCVIEHRTWFEIEFCRKSHRLFRDIMLALRPRITSRWSIQAKDREPIFYRLFCQEVFFLLETWSGNGFIGSQEPEIEVKLQKMVAAFASGNINIIMTSILY